MLVRDCQETVSRRGERGDLWRTYMPLPPREGDAPVKYAASLEDLAETLALVCEANNSAPLPIRKAAVLAELERHAEMPKRP